MRILAIYPRFNTEGRRDATGAFQPKAREFLQTHRISWTADNTIVFDNTATMAMRKAILKSHMRTPRPELSTIAFFCHGWKDGLQCGFRSIDIPAFVRLLSEFAPNLVSVVLYACDNGRDGDDDRHDDMVDGIGGDGGFADLLRDEFRRRGGSVTVFAHATEGHTTDNPYVREFIPTETTGGRFIIEPKDALWGPWRRALKGTDLWARFPFMTRQEVRNELESAA